MHVVRHYFDSDIRHGSCFELLEAVGCRLFLGYDGSNFASCDGEQVYDLQPRRIVVPVFTRKFDNSHALSLLQTC